MDKSTGTKLKLSVKISKNGKYMVSTEGGHQVTVETKVGLPQDQEPTNESAAVGSALNRVADGDFVALPENKMIVTRINDDGSVFTQSHEESGEYSSETSKMV